MLYQLSYASENFSLSHGAATLQQRPNKSEYSKVFAAWGTPRLEFRRLFPQTTSAPSPRVRNALIPAAITSCARNPSR